MTRTLILPENVIHEIAFLSDELTVWRLMGTSRAARNAAEPALRRFLGERRVVLKPPIVEYTFSSPIIPSDNRSTKLPLNELTHRFESHLDAYLPSATHIRNLIVEARDDSLAGWNLIERFSTQLERLELHFVDGRWLKQGQRSTKRLYHVWVPHTHYGYNNWYGEPDTASYWDPPLKYLRITFPNLTELILVATARIFPLLEYFIDLAPNLRALTLNCFCGDAGIIDDDDKEWSFWGLDRLTCSGYHLMMLSMGKIFGGNTPDLRHLILNVDNSKFTKDDGDDPDPDWIAEFTTVCHQLEGIAMYGEASYFFDIVQEGNQTAGDGGADFTSLTTLVLEEQTKLGGGQENAYAMLAELEHRPELPALTKIVWVDRRLDARGHLRSAKSSAPLELFDEHALRLLFERYPTLHEALWVNDYPPDPFADDFGSASFERHVICRETRAKWIDESGDPAGGENPEVRLGLDD